MNWEHLKTFVWLRWRLAANQMKRAGTANFVISMIFLVLAVLLSLGLFFIALFVGLFALPDAPPLAVLLTWDGIVVAFLFFWLVGLLAELQRSEMLALDKFLHLPVSLSGVFVMNYLASLVSLSLIVFLPAMLGLSLALVATKGPALLLTFPLLAAFLLVVTALTHQFRGWLAALMQNKRRRRTVVVVATMSIILLLQAPNLINILQPWNRNQEAIANTQQELAKLDRDLAEGRIDAGEHNEKRGALFVKQAEEVQQGGRRVWEKVESWAAFLNLVLPPGWLPYGAMSLALGEITPALAGIGVMTLVGVVSLRRSYRTTMRLYTGQFTSGKAPAAPSEAAPKPAMVAPVGSRPVGSRGTLLEKSLPWVSEHASAIATACFRSLTRAPEAKMILMTPFLMVVIFGSMLLSRSMDPGVYLRPLMAAGASAMVLMSMTQLLGNQFGFDRSGFRVFVLCSAPRREILLGKNLAAAPLVLGLSVILLFVLQLLYPMRVDLLLAAVAQAVAMYLIFCLLSNLLSILAPMPVATGTLKPTKIKGLVFLMHLLFTLLYPLALLPTLVPLGMEFAAAEVWKIEGLPICLVLTLLELAAMGVLYHFALGWQGQLLQSREKRILETVAAKTE